MRSYSANLYYTSTLNSVANRMTYDPQTGARVYKKENVMVTGKQEDFFIQYTVEEQEIYNFI